MTGRVLTRRARLDLLEIADWVGNAILTRQIVSLEGCWLRPKCLIGGPLLGMCAAILLRTERPSNFGPSAAI